MSGLSNVTDNLKGKIVLIDCGSGSTPKIADLLSELWQIPDILQMGLANTELGSKTTPESVSALVISGGPHLFTDPGKRNELLAHFDFLKNWNRPTLGICLGHQAIGLINGADIYLGTARRETEDINQTTEHRLFKDIVSGVEFRTDHCEGISTPENYSVIASSENYPVEAIANDRLPIFGVQFHPEISDAPGRQLFINFVSIAREFCA